MGKKQHVSAITQRGTLDKLVYDCRVFLEFKNGEKIDYPDVGEFSGVSFTDVKVTIKDV